MVRHRTARTLVTLLLLALAAGSARAARVETGGFPRLDAAARGTALSGNLTALASGPDALYWNPAGLLDLERREVAFTYADLFGAGLVSQSAVQVAWPRARRQLTWENGAIRRVSLPPPADYAIGLAVNSLRGDLGDDDYYLEFQLGAGYAWRLPAGFRTGLAYRYLNARSDLRETGGEGHTLDLGVMRPVGPLTLGLNAANLVSVMHWRAGSDGGRARPDLDEPLAERWSAALAWRLDRPGLVSTVQGDWSGASFQAVQRGAGLEWTPHRALALRGGYRHRHDALDPRDEWSAGIGVRAGGFRIDYGFQTNARDLGETHRWTAGVAL